MKKKDLLSKKVEHIDIKKINAVDIINAMKKMSFSARDLANAADIYDRMLREKNCAVILTLAGSTSAAGCMQVYVDLVKNNMIDAIVATGASIVDMDFFEALGFKHYQGTPFIDDKLLRKLYIDRIYDTFISENDLQACDRAIKKIADALDPRPYSSREFIAEMGRYLVKNAKKKNSLVQAAYENDVPIFCPAFSDSSAGFGLVLHQNDRPDNHISIDSVKDFRELTDIKIKAGTSGLLMKYRCTNSPFKSPWRMCATEPAPAPRSKKPIRGARWILPANRWFTLKRQRYCRFWPVMPIIKEAGKSAKSGSCPKSSMRKNKNFGMRGIAQNR